MTLLMAAACGGVEARGEETTERPSVTAPEPLPAPADEPSAAAADARRVIDEALARSAQAAEDASAEAMPEAEAV
ncbi:hypothetical protein EBU58_13215, partial [bacterium]|nr:hypothetical protein [bacterium]